MLPWRRLNHSNARRTSPAVDRISGDGDEETRDHLVRGSHPYAHGAGEEGEHPGQATRNSGIVTPSQACRCPQLERGRRRGLDRGPPQIDRSSRRCAPRSNQRREVLLPYEPGRPEGRLGLARPHEWWRQARWPAVSVECRTPAPRKHYRESRNIRSPLSEQPMTTMSSLLRRAGKLADAPPLATRMPVTALGRCDNSHRRGRQRRPPVGGASAGDRSPDGPQRHVREVIDRELCRGGRPPAPGPWGPNRAPARSWSWSAPGEPGFRSLAAVRPRRARSTGCCSAPRSPASR